MKNIGTLYLQVVCLNGHQKTDRGKAGTELGFCEECGSQLINTCPDCNAIIPGRFVDNGAFVTTGHRVRVPKYCNHCGTPYPWTKTAIETANEIIDLDDALDNVDKDSFKKTIPDLISETPKTKLALTKFKIFSSKISQVISDGLRDVLIDVVAESVKKSIWGA